MFQSYIFTTAKYDFSVYEKRILYRQIEIEQELLTNEALRSAVKIETSLWGDRRYTIPISVLLNGEEDKNHKRIKEAFESLRLKKIEYEDDEIYSCFGIVSSYEIKKRAKTVTWVSPSKIVEAVMDFTKGWRKYELKIAMQFESAYSMRLYELFSNKHQPISYTVSELEKMFQLENKYRSPNGKLNLSNLRKFILDRAQRELNACSPFTFDYHISKDKKTVSFIPIFQQKFADGELRKRRVETKYNIKHVLNEREIDTFINEFGFTEQGLLNNYALFQECKNVLPENYTFFLFQEIRKAIIGRERKLPPYIIGIIRNHLNDYKIYSEQKAKPKRKKFI